MRDLRPLTRRERCILQQSVLFFGVKGGVTKGRLFLGYYLTPSLTYFSYSLSTQTVSHQQETPTALSDSGERHPNEYYERITSAVPGDEIRSMAGYSSSVRTDWKKEEIAEIFNLPMHELMYRAATVHRMYWNPGEVQQCTLLSIKTGGCTEDCKYCSQSVRNKTFVKPTPTMKVQEVLEAAKRAKEAGSTRFCMGAAWRELGGKVSV